MCKLCIIGEWLYWTWQSSCSHTIVFVCQTSHRPGARVHKSFQNQDQAQSYILSYYGISLNLLELINYWLLVCSEICASNKTSRNSQHFNKRKGKFYSRHSYEKLSLLNNRINCSKLKLVSNMYFNLMHFRSKTTFTPVNVYRSQVFLNR